MPKPGSDSASLPYSNSEYALSTSIGAHQLKVLHNIENIRLAAPHLLHGSRESRAFPFSPPVYAAMFLCPVLHSKRHLWDVVAAIGVVLVRHEEAVFQLSVPE